MSGREHFAGEEDGQKKTEEELQQEEEMELERRVEYVDEYWAEMEVVDRELYPELREKSGRQFLDALLESAIHEDIEGIDALTRDADTIKATYPVRMKDANGFHMEQPRELNLLQMAATIGLPRVLVEFFVFLNGTTMVDRDGNTLLHYIASQGHVACLLALLDEEDDIKDISVEDLVVMNKRNAEGKTPLHLALEYSDVLTRVIYDDPEGFAAEEQAVAQAHVEARLQVAEFLLKTLYNTPSPLNPTAFEDPANLHCKDDVGTTAFHNLARLGSLPLARSLITHFSKNQSELAVTDSLGATVLHVATKDRREEFVLDLLAVLEPAGGKRKNHALSPFARDNFGKSPFYYVAFHDMTSALTTMIRFIPSDDEELLHTDRLGRTPLLLAADRGSVNAMAELVKRPSATAVDAFGLTLAHYTAARLSATPVLDDVFGYRQVPLFEPTMTDIASNSPLHYAVRYAQGDAVLRMLREPGMTATPNALGDTPLHIALRVKNLAAATVLLDHDTPEYPHVFPEPEPEALRAILASTDSGLGADVLETEGRSGAKSVARDFATAISMAGLGGRTPLHELLRAPSPTELAAGNVLVHPEYIAAAAAEAKDALASGLVDLEDVIAHDEGHDVALLNSGKLVGFQFDDASPFPYPRAAGEVNDAIDSFHDMLAAFYAEPGSADDPYNGEREPEVADQLDLAAVVESLLLKHAPVGARDAAGRTCLHDAAASPVVSHIVYRQLFLGSDERLANAKYVVATDTSGNTPIHEAAGAGNGAALLIFASSFASWVSRKHTRPSLLDTNASVGGGSTGRSAADAASQDDFIELTDEELEVQDFFSNLLGDDAVVLEDLAVAGRHALGRLVAAFREPNADGRTPLMLAAAAGHDAVAIMLLKVAGIEELFFADTDGCTAFLLACREGATGLISTMFEEIESYEPLLAARTKAGESGMVLAAKHGRLELLQDVLIPGLQDSPRLRHAACTLDTMGWSVLHYLAAVPAVEPVIYLDERKSLAPVVGDASGAASVITSLLGALYDYHDPTTDTLNFGFILSAGTSTAKLATPLHIATRFANPHAADALWQFMASTSLPEPLDNFDLASVALLCDAYGFNVVHYAVIHDMDNLVGDMMQTSIAEAAFEARAVVPPPTPRGRELSQGKTPWPPSKSDLVAAIEGIRRSAATAAHLPHVPLTGPGSLVADEGTTDFVAPHFDRSLEWVRLAADVETRVDALPQTPRDDDPLLDIGLQFLISLEDKPLTDAQRRQVLYNVYEAPVIDMKYASENDVGLTPLQIAALYGSSLAGIALLEAYRAMADEVPFNPLDVRTGSKMSATEPYAGYLACHLAALRPESAELLEELLNDMDDRNVKTHDGCNALMVALKASNLAAVRVALTFARADISADAGSLAKRARKHARDASRRGRGTNKAVTEDSRPLLLNTVSESNANILHYLAAFDAPPKTKAAAVSLVKEAIAEAEAEAEGVDTPQPVFVSAFSLGPSRLLEELLVTADTTSGGTPLHIATKMGNAHFVDAFVDVVLSAPPSPLGSLFAQRDANAMTPVAYAVVNTMKPLLDRLSKDKGKRLSSEVLAARAGGKASLLLLAAARVYYEAELDAAVEASLADNPALERLVTGVPLAGAPEAGHNSDDDRCSDYGDDDESGFGGGQEGGPVGHIDDVTSPIEAALSVLDLITSAIQAAEQPLLLVQDICNRASLVNATLVGQAACARAAVIGADAVAFVADLDARLELESHLRSGTALHLLAATLPAASTTARVLGGLLAEFPATLDVSGPLQWLAARDPSRGEATPLMVAVEAGNLPVAEALIKLFVDYSALNVAAHLALTNSAGENVVHLAARFGRSSVVKAILDSNADGALLNARGGPHGATPFLEAASSSSVTLVRMLEELPEIDVSVRDARGASAVHYAVSSPRAVDMLAFLLSLPQLADGTATVDRIEVSLDDADAPHFEYTCPWLKGTPAGVDPELVDLLSSGHNNELNTGAGTSDSRSGNLASTKKNPDAAQSRTGFLFSVSERRYDGKTPLFLALEAGNATLAAALMEQPSFVAATRDARDETLYHAAVRGRLPQFISLALTEGRAKLDNFLARASAEPNIDGETPLLLAVKSCLWPAIAQLRETYELELPLNATSPIAAALEQHNYPLAMHLFSASAPKSQSCDVAELVIQPLLFAAHAATDSFASADGWQSGAKPTSASQPRFAGDEGEKNLNSGLATLSPFDDRPESGLLHERLALGYVYQVLGLELTRVSLVMDHGAFAKALEACAAGKLAGAAHALLAFQRLIPSARVLAEAASGTGTATAFGGARGGIGGALGGSSPTLDSMFAPRQATLLLASFVRYGVTAVVRTILKYGLVASPLDHPDNFNRSVLHIACAAGAHDVAELILRFASESQVNDPGFKEMTPLHLAARAGLGTVANLLVLSSGANAAAESNNSQTPLHLAILSRREDIALLLVAAAPESVVIATPEGYHAGHLAARKGLGPVASTLFASQHIRLDATSGDGDANSELSLLAAVAHGGSPFVLAELLRERSNRMNNEVGKVDRRERRLYKDQSQTKRTLLNMFSVTAVNDALSTAFDARSDVVIRKMLARTASMLVEPEFELDNSSEEVVMTSAFDVAPLLRRVVTSPKCSTEREPLVLELFHTLSPVTPLNDIATASGVVCRLPLLVNDLICSAPGAAVLSDLMRMATQYGTAPETVFAALQVGSRLEWDVRMGLQVVFDDCPGLSLMIIATLGVDEAVKDEAVKEACLSCNPWDYAFLTFALDQRQPQLAYAALEAYWRSGASRELPAEFHTSHGWYWSPMAKAIVSRHLGLLRILGDSVDGKIFSDQSISPLASAVEKGDTAGALVLLSCIREATSADAEQVFLTSGLEDSSTLEKAVSLKMVSVVRSMISVWPDFLASQQGSAARSVVVEARGEVAVVLLSALQLGARSTPHSLRYEPAVLSDLMRMATQYGTAPETVFAALQVGSRLEWDVRMGLQVVFDDCPGLSLMIIATLGVDEAVKDEAVKEACLSCNPWDYAFLTFALDQRQPQLAYAALEAYWRSGASRELPAEFHTSHGWYWSPMAKAIVSRHLGLLRILGDSVDGKIFSDQSISPLASAVEKGDTAGALVLLSCIREATSADAEQVFLTSGLEDSSTLEKAVSLKMVSVVRSMISVWPDFLASQQGSAARSVVVEARGEVAVVLLSALKLGARSTPMESSQPEVSLRDSDVETKVMIEPFAYMCASQCMPGVRFLLTDPIPGMNKTSGNVSPTAYTPLHYAAASGNVDLLCRLLAILAPYGELLRAALVENENPVKATPLVAALMKGKAGTAMVLIKGMAAMLPPDELVAALTMLSDQDGSAMHFAARAGLTEVVRTLIRLGVPASGKLDASDLPSPLLRSVMQLSSTASASEHVETARYLLASGADVGGKGASGKTALHYAAEVGSLELVLALFKNSLVGDRLGRSALHYAAMGGQVAVALAILSASVSPSSLVRTDSFGAAAIHYAAVSSHPRSYLVCRALQAFQHDAELAPVTASHVDPGVVSLVDHVDAMLSLRGGSELSTAMWLRLVKTPLCLAALLGNTASALALLRAGESPAPTEAQGGHSLASVLVASAVLGATTIGRAVLRLAASEEWLDVSVTSLLQTKTPAQREDGSQGETGGAGTSGPKWGGDDPTGKVPLAVAARGGKWEFVLGLIAANTELPRAQRSTLEELSSEVTLSVAKTNQVDVARALIANYDLQWGVPGDGGSDLAGKAPLFVACANGSWELALMLLGIVSTSEDKRLAVNNVVDHAGPIHWAAEAGQMALIKALVASRANVNLLDEKKRSPLYIACQQRHLDVVEYLLLNTPAEIMRHNSPGAKLPLHAACSAEAIDEVRLSNPVSIPVVKAILSHAQIKQVLEVESRPGSGALAGAGRGEANASQDNSLLLAITGSNPSLALLIIDFYKKHAVSLTNLLKTMVHTLASRQVCTAVGRSGELEQTLFYYNGYPVCAVCMSTCRLGDAWAADRVDTFSCWCFTSSSCKVREALPRKLFTSVVTILIGKDATIELEDVGDDTTFLMYCCKEGLEELALLLLSKDVEVAATNGNNSTALHFAAEFGLLSVVEQLVSGHRELAVDAVDNDGFTPLHLACRSGHDAVAKFLLDAMRDKTAEELCKTTRDQKTPMHLLAPKITRMPETFKTLINRASLAMTMLDAESRTPLMIAHEVDGVDLKTLVSLVALTGDKLLHAPPINLDVEQAQSSGRPKYSASVLHMAALKGELGLVQAILEELGKRTKSQLRLHTELASFGITAPENAAAYPYAGLGTKLTPLHLAVMKSSAKSEADRIEIVELLLAADPQLLETPDGAGRTPLHLAAEAGFVKGAAVLVEYAKPRNKDILNVRDGSAAKRTPLRVAVKMTTPSAEAASGKDAVPVKSAQLEMIKYLVGEGALLAPDDGNTGRTEPILHELIKLPDAAILDVVEKLIEQVGAAAGDDDDGSGSGGGPVAQEFVGNAVDNRDEYGFADGESVSGDGSEGGVDRNSPRGATSRGGRMQELANEVDGDGNTPLHVACNNVALPDMALLLMEHLPGLDVNAQNHLGETPLMRLVMASDGAKSNLDEVITELIAAGADTSLVRRSDGGTVLHALLEKETSTAVGYVETIIDALNEFEGTDVLKATVVTKNRSSRSPLHVLLLNKKLDRSHRVLVRKLIEAGADVTDTCDGGRNALMLALNASKDVFAREVLDAHGDQMPGSHNDRQVALQHYGPMLEATDDHGATILHYALRNKHVALARQFLPDPAASYGGDDALFESQEFGGGTYRKHRMSRNDSTASGIGPYDAYDEYDDDGERLSARSGRGGYGGGHDDEMSMRSGMGHGEAAPLENEYNLPAESRERILLDARDSENSNMTALHLACKEGACKQVALDIVATGRADVNLADYNSKVALHYASETGAKDLVKALLLRGLANPTLRDGSGQTPLHSAIQHGHDDVAKTLLAEFSATMSQIIPRERAREAAEQAKAAAARGHEVHEGEAPVLDEELEAAGGAASAVAFDGSMSKEQVARAVAKERETFVNGLCGGYTALHRALVNQRLGLLQQLFVSGASLVSRTVMSPEGDTPLHLAARECPKAIPVLLEEARRQSLTALQLDVKNSAGNTPVHVAVASDAPELRDLLQFPFSPNAFNNKLQTPLSIAIETESAMVQHLLENSAKADVLVRKGDDSSDSMPVGLLHVAHEKRRPELMKMLLDKGADVVSVNAAGENILHVLVKEKNNDMGFLQSLIGRIGTGINATPLHLATLRGHAHIAEQLVRVNCGLNIQDYKMRTALHIAAERADLAIVASILSTRKAELHLQDMNGRVASQLLSKTPAARALMAEYASLSPRAPYALSVRRMYAAGSNAFGELGLPQSATEGSGPGSSGAGEARGASLSRNKSRRWGKGPSVGALSHVEFFRRKRATFVATGSYTTLVVFDSGEVYTFGWNEQGDTGFDASENVVEMPRLMKALEGVHIVTGSMGSSFGAVVSDAGAVYTFGADNDGQLGRPSGSSMPSPGGEVGLVADLVGERVVEISCGASMAGVVTDGGELFTWGRARATGRGTTAVVPPGKALGFVPEDLVERFETSGTLSVAITRRLDTEFSFVYAAGEDTYGAVGMGRDDFVESEFTLLPTHSVPGLKTQLLDVAVGQWHVLLLTASGEVYASGTAMYGQIGLGSAASVATFTKINHGLDEPIAKIDAGRYHSSAISRSGVWYCWGDSAYRKNGHIADETVYAPRKVALTETDVLEHVACGVEYTLYINSAGSLFGLGYNDYSCLGLAGAYKWATVSPPVEVTSVTIGLPSMMAVGLNFTAVVTENGGLFTYGHNESGQCGRKSSTRVDVARVGIGGRHDQFEYVVQAVTAGDYHVAVIDEVNDLYTMGRNAAGQLGRETDGLFRHELGKVEFPRVPTKARESSASVGGAAGAEGASGTSAELVAKSAVMTKPDKVKVFLVSAFADTTVAYTSAGLFAWGANDSGQLGIGYKSERETTPKLVQLEHTVVQIAGSRNITMFLTAEDGLFVTGEGKALGPIGPTSTPRRVTVEDTTINEEKSVVFIAAGPRFCAAVTYDGQLWMVGDLASSRTYTRVDLYDPLGAFTVIEVAPYGDGLVFLTDSGELREVMEVSEGPSAGEAVEALLESGKVLTFGTVSSELKTVLDNDDDDHRQVVLSMAGSASHLTVSTMQLTLCGERINKNEYMPPTVLVLGLPRGTSQELVRSRFSNYGTVVSVSLQLFKRAAFVGMESLAAAEAAAAAMHLNFVEFGERVARVKVRVLPSCALECEVAESPMPRSDFWYRWRDVRELPFSRSDLLTEHPELSYALSPLLLCSKCTRDKGFKYAITKRSKCRELSRDEVAKKVNECQAAGRKYLDDAFLPSEAALWNDPDKPGDPHYITYPSTWRRLSDLFETMPNPRVFIDGAEGADVEQGGIGTCYLLGCVAVLATNQEYIEKVFIKPWNVDVGIYSLMFSHNKLWKYVIIDDYVPCLESTQGADPWENPLPVYAWSADRNEMYVMLIEKAYAKFKGSYEAIDGGVDRYAMVDLTGGVCEALKFDDPKISRSLKTGAFWETMVLYKAQNKLMSCYIEDLSADNEEPTEQGLLKGHAYAITGVCVVGANRLLQIRNPHGSTTWSGAWHDLKQEVVGGDVVDDGQFYMSYNDFIKGFTAVDVTTLLPDSDDVALPGASPGSRAHDAGGLDVEDLDTLELAVKALSGAVENLPYADGAPASLGAASTESSGTPSGGVTGNAAPLAGGAAQPAVDALTDKLRSMAENPAADAVVDPTLAAAWMIDGTVTTSSLGGESETASGARKQVFRLDWAEGESGCRKAFALKLGRKAADVTVEIRQQTADESAIDGKAVTLLVCRWRTGVDYFPANRERGAVLASDLRTADIVDRIFPSRATKASLSLYLPPSKDYTYVIVPSLMSAGPHTAFLSIFTSSTVRVDPVQLVEYLWDSKPATERDIVEGTGQFFVFRDDAVETDEEDESGEDPLDAEKAALQEAAVGLPASLHPVTVGGTSFAPARVSLEQLAAEAAAVPRAAAAPDIVPGPVAGVASPIPHGRLAPLNPYEAPAPAPAAVPGYAAPSPSYPAYQAYPGAQGFQGHQVYQGYPSPGYGGQTVGQGQAPAPVHAGAYTSPLVAGGPSGLEPRYGGMVPVRETRPSSTASSMYMSQASEEVFGGISTRAQPSGRGQGHVGGGGQLPALPRRQGGVGRGTEAGSAERSPIPRRGGGGGAPSRRDRGRGAAALPRLPREAMAARAARRTPPRRPRRDNP
ncbi:uncharacterized protein AMSG_05321 [Thecamonas trahens ATCC 50062]|uniref:Ankyrin repeat protein n=1 Tax=Thecamonas trahens ATCC 50062 TaxID=461836 RepID=A0A0L0DDB7_THETB|nr:hypothetical protein AMSG_05321 [Thecamonas trahens ATCC 50062]KNC49323.1 hypothetical protein AMSG_05321 [Thecamonas trahens ATCC 50062]|eukprot:XP_013758031.1 hypothetical protein AMSG_05321 [Thecamonas trahens ATCC 50062]